MQWQRGNVSDTEEELKRPDVAAESSNKLSVEGTEFNAQAM